MHHIMKKLVLFMNHLLEAKAPLGQDLSITQSTLQRVILSVVRHISLHLAIFPCLADLTSVSADNVEASYSDHSVAHVGVPRRQGGCQIQRPLHLCRLVAIMPR